MYPYIYYYYLYSINPVDYLCVPILSGDTFIPHVSSFCVAGKKTPSISVTYSLNVSITYPLKYFLYARGLCLSFIRFDQAPAFDKA